MTEKQMNEKCNGCFGMGEVQPQLGTWAHGKGKGKDDAGLGQGG
jgi:hypothetical protein